MSKNILQIDGQNFDLAGFLNELEENLGEKFNCVYMKPSMEEKDVYDELDEKELDKLNIKDKYQDELAENDRILYARFEIDEVEPNEDFYFCNDWGFIIKSKNGIITIYVAEYDGEMSGQGVATVLDEDEVLEEMEILVNKYASRSKEGLTANDIIIDLNKEAIELIEEFFEEQEVICGDNVLLDIEASDDARQITTRELGDYEKTHDLINIAYLLKYIMRGFGPYGSMFYEGIELAKEELSYEDLGKEKYIEEMGKICYLEERAEDILSRLEEIEEEAKAIW